MNEWKNDSDVIFWSINICQMNNEWVSEWDVIAVLSRQASQLLISNLRQPTGAPGSWVHSTLFHSKSLENPTSSDTQCTPFPYFLLRSSETVVNYFCLKWLGLCFFMQVWNAEGKKIFVCHTPPNTIYLENLDMPHLDIDQCYFLPG